MKAIRLYAQVLVDVLSTPGFKYPMDKTMKELEKFAALTTESKLMNQVFDNPVMPDDQKHKALRAFTQKMDMSQISEKFVSMLVKRNRLSILPAILSEIESIQIQKTGGLMGEVVSATPLNEGTLSTITQAISKKMNKTVQLKQKVDPNLIAGLRVTVGGKTFDGSVRTKLNRVKDSFQ